jgi:hypothetical protein
LITSKLGAGKRYSRATVLALSLEGITQATSAHSPLCRVSVQVKFPTVNVKDNGGSKKIDVICVYYRFVVVVVRRNKRNGTAHKANERKLERVNSEIVGLAKKTITTLCCTVCALSRKEPRERESEKHPYNDR